MGVPAQQVLAQAAQNRANEMEMVEELYWKYSTQVYRFLLYRVGDTYQAQELCQIVFEKVVKKYNTYNPAHGGSKVWLFTIARNTLNDYFRHSKRVVFTVLEENLCASGQEPEQFLLDREQHELLGCALQKLSKREQLAISLKYGGSLRNKEIAQVLGITEKNTGVILCRSLRKLQKQLAKESL